jgi:hypothetical protein
MKVKEEIMLANLHIDQKWKKIGVRLSGGADSSILYYAICDYFKNNDEVEIYPLTMDTELKWWYSRGAKQVIDRVSELTGKSPKDWYIHYNPHFTNRTELQKYEDGINELQRTAVKKYGLDAIYIGLTINPPINDMKTYFTNNSDGLDVERIMGHINGRDMTRDGPTDPEVMTCHYENNITVKQIIPFVNLNKKAVKKMYEHYNVMETLYPITYSCEKVLEVKNEPLTHCGYCFFCLERKWGFGRIV